MKVLSALSFLALAAAIAIPTNQAMAGDKEKAIIGGLIGGIIIGAALSDDDVSHHTTVSIGSGRHDHGGYWEWVTVKHWNPGYYRRECDRYGHSRRIWISGYYSYTKKKVWVNSRHGSNYRHNDHYSRNDRRGDGHYRDERRYDDRGRDDNRRNNDRRDDNRDTRRKSSYQNNGQVVSRF
ncbi:hypothetical protein [Pelagicoccus albus]|uniref:Uncharacterized protein n=1 Tax=Pelagicoccus albus TaxID=415222 RepID=A0A7X1B8R7_9BACT|nr:hypothetical protein [Pelagicoccus albus]MBC2607652.1 hypothetical protein [Pelagicoccus albus]